ncbi:chromosome partitioning protein ParB [Chroococcidiopsis sp. CCALA 051]|uniref:ParB/RepB/Spo0J family partition protein n=1 Tax=Chroococcidiopsis sp. CCALA 051 TaxID=869949 RepID=UPI000D0CE89D|nr:ParB/RepB/Spo0J family partition protein [Chroococcidiopsis sp. CCALA 051]PSM45812.1 chromosome partitioning protein ParB [Chroococcidiopsis sp. CCALA 051]
MAGLDRTSKTQSDIRADKFRDILNFVPENLSEIAANAEPDEINFDGKHQIGLSEICLPQQQPRRYFDPQALKELASSVKQHGILQPLLVRPLSSGRYELVAGERRYHAAKEANLVEVPVVVRELSDETALQLALIENLQREDLNPVEETEGILQLLALKLEISSPEVAKLLYRMQNEVKGKVTHNVMGSLPNQVIQATFEAIGLMDWESFVTNRLPLLNLPIDILEALRQGKIAYTKAQAIARVKDEEHRQALLETAIAENLSLGQIKERVASIADKQANSISSVTSSLKSRMDAAYRLVKKSKIWADPKKQKRLDKLLTELEALASK